MEDTMGSAAEIIFENIKNRRTLPYQRMKVDAIQAGHLATILEAANWAPSHRHTEPWSFFVFQGEGRSQLSHLLCETYRATAGPNFKEKKYQKAIDRPSHTPLVIAVVMKWMGKNPEFQELMAVGGALQNLHLAAQSLGIGCALSTPAYLDHANIRDYFKLNTGDRCLGFLYLGYPAEDWPQSKRGPVADKITYITERSKHK